MYISVISNKMGKKILFARIFPIKPEHNTYNTIAFALENGRAIASFYRNASRCLD